MTAMLEVSLAWLFKNAKGRDAKAFYTRPALAGFAEQTITVTSPDCGATNATLAVDYTADGAGKFPALQWAAPPELEGRVREWLLVSEDPDAPLPTPICHGIYTGIPPTKTSVEAADFEVADKAKALLKGGFHYGKNIRGSVYGLPRPLMNHGPHRYFYMVVALEEPLDPKLLAPTATREQIADAIVGKVLGWGIKLDELVQEIQSIKQSVGSVSLPPQGTTQQHDGATCPLQGPAVPRLGLPSPSSGPSDSTSRYSGPEAANGVVVDPSQILHTPAVTLPQEPGIKPSLSRALGSHPFSGEDIDYYFQKYFECYHPYMPIVRERDPNKCYESGPLLFWSILFIASRRYARDGTALPFLLDSVRREMFTAITILPLSLSSINALILVCSWIFPDVRFVNDPTALFSSVTGNASMLLGIHTGKGAHPEFSHGAFQNSFTDEEAALTWTGYNIIAQRVSSYLGLPPLGSLFNQAVQNVIDGRVPFHVPPGFRVLLECQKFCNRVSKTMVAYLEESRGVSAHVVQLLEDEWDAVKGLVCSERADDLDRFNALLAQFEIQVYYMLPLPGYNPENLKRYILRTYTTAQSVLRDALQLERKMKFIHHIPHFHFRALLLASSVVHKLLRSSYMEFVGCKAAEQSASDAIAVCKLASVMEGDLPARLHKLIESFSDGTRKLQGPQSREEPISMFSHRLSASAALDWLMRWKHDHVASGAKCPAQQQQNQQDSVAHAAGAGAGAAACAERVDTPALLAGEPMQNIDWSFMDDFDWNLEPGVLWNGTPR
ncbi:Uu.00g003180.m01.CDS01 [Anthostomella pinea]|uniref:Uu.00g003180.m01.CDS01 n=1 Tax=Anthostomella pinea TaxID=933095 RepID=A0AAI8VED6_9PEZI|nr:Uu.00g003180.m01.CDS01 [Anthostomella pinea]